MDEIPEQERSEDIEGGAEPAKPARRAVKRRKKKAAPAQQRVKVDPAQALAFVRSRIRESKDPIVKALYEREEAELAERVKKAEEQRIASLSFKTKDGKSVKIGDTVCRIVGSGRGGFRRYADTPQDLGFEELFIKNIAPSDRQYAAGEKVVTATLVNGKGSRTLTVGQYAHDDVYSSRDACFNAAIASASEELEEKRIEYDEAARELAAIEALRDGRQPEPRAEAPRRPRRRGSPQQSLPLEEQPTELAS